MGAEQIINWIFKKEMEVQETEGEVNEYKI
jgi:hypothetical protein